VTLPASIADRTHSGFIGWWHEADARAQRAFVAASLGWMLDAFDIMLYSLVLASLMHDLNLSKGEGGVLSSVTLVGGAAGGLLFGGIADRYGRKRALMGSVLLYSIFTALCGLATNLWQFVVFRALLGVGMGGEWASGAALVAETWPAATRSRAFGFIQSSWAIGYGAAAVVTGFVLPRWGWRAAFFVGVLPALLTLWIRRSVEEPAMWKAQSTTAVPLTSRVAELFRSRYRGATVAITAMNACTLFAWWGLNTWVPAYLVLSPAEGGVGLSIVGTSGVVFIMQVGMWLGYVSFGFVTEAIGRRRAYVSYLIAASVLLPTYGFVRNPIALLALGPLVAFFGTGYFSGFGPLTAEAYPTAIRATAQGVTYNTGRLASAAAPFIVGSLASARGFGFAFSVAGSAFLLAAVLWIAIPDTRGGELR
jgi:MFS family permease